MKRDEWLKKLVELSYEYRGETKFCVNCGSVSFDDNFFPGHEDDCVVGEVEVYLQHLQDFERNWQQLQAEEMQNAD